MNTRRLLTLATVLALLLPFGAAGAQTKPVIVTTGFPHYDWMRVVLGGRNSAFHLVLPGDSGADLHSFQPSAGDFIEILTADLLVYNGGVSDVWLTKPVAERDAAGLLSVNLMQALGEGVKCEETVEGMQVSGHEDHDHDADDDHDQDSAALLAGTCSALDEHIWLSLRNAQALVPVLAEAVAALDPAYADTYRTNAQAYLVDLKELDAAYQAAADAATVDTLLLADRFPFLYMMYDYNIAYYAAFNGCSTESEASFETVAFLAQKTKELGLANVLIIEGANEKLARTVIDAAGGPNAEILRLNAMQAVSLAQREEGATYLGLMRDNLTVLKQALGVQ